MQPIGNPQTSLIQTADVGGYAKVQVSINCSGSSWTKLSYYLY
jgi:hypothetical protein